MTARSIKMFRIMRKLGHAIAAWDEEALVHMQPEIYYSRRLSPVAIKMVSHLFAWGDENADLWRHYPDLPKDIPIHITGNPRGDMLRPGIHGYFAPESKDLLERYGDFILVNTNFSNVNAFYPSQNLFKPCEDPGKPPEFGLAAVGMSREFAESLRDYKQSIFNDFTQLIPALEKAFPTYTIIVRPHPTESPKVYQDIASRCARVRVTNEGNVLPWLRAAKALVHNGCTTAIEAYLMGVPAVSFQATVNDYFDSGFYRLPNALSHQCFTYDELAGTLNKILAGELGPAQSAERKALMGHYLSAQDGRLACQRIVDVLENIATDFADLPRPSLQNRQCGRFQAVRRRVKKKLKSFRPDSKYRPEFQRHRYPGMSLEDMRSKVLRFQGLLGQKEELSVKQLTEYIFRISKRENA
jgi:surface carbohydrate biosynthesis protein